MNQSEEQVMLRDAITVNLMRLANLDKHTARDIADSVLSVSTRKQADERFVMHSCESENGGKIWYVDAPEFYADIAQEKDTGKWSIFFRDKSGNEGYAEKVESELSMSMFASKSDYEKAKASQLTEPEKCFCDTNNIGEPGVSCGDCPIRDYNTLQKSAAISDALDAARYRWLRTALKVTDGTFFIGVDSPEYVGKWALEGEEADRAIDEAKKEAKNNEQRSTTTTTTRARHKIW